MKHPRRPKPATRESRKLSTAHMGHIDWYVVLDHQSSEPLPPCSFCVVESNNRVRLCDIARKCSNPLRLPMLTFNKHKHVFVILVGVG